MYGATEAPRIDCPQDWMTEAPKMKQNEPRVTTIRLFRCLLKMSEYDADVVAVTSGSLPT